MNDILHKTIVLVLNRNWQAINTTTPALAFGQMATDVATGLDIQGPDWMVPVKWADWLKLPVGAQDFSIGTARGAIRVPTVVVLSRFNRVPLKRPKFSLRGLWDRDRGRCQYTGRSLSPREGNIDHVLPRSRGGSTTWENCVLADREVNQRKADRTPDEAGLRLAREPEPPRELPVTWFIRNLHDIPEWEVFLPRRGERPRGLPGSLDPQAGSLKQ
jgi:5-methylcytosine-specific restriction endonuclease McrA